MNVEETRRPEPSERKNVALTGAVDEPGRGWPFGATAIERKFGNGTTRIVVASIAIPLFVGVFYLGGWWVALLVALMSTGALLELYWMLERVGVRPFKAIGVIGGLSVLLFFAGSDFILLLRSVFPSVGVSSADRFCTVVMLPAVAVLVSIAVLVSALRRDNRSGLRDAAGTLLGFLYVSLLMGTVLGVHHSATLFGSEQLIARAGTDIGGGWGGSPESAVGAMLILVTFAGIWTCDSFAYFGGRAFGRHRLFERVSPKKTWEGAVCGALAAVVACIVLAGALDGLLWYDGLVIGIIAGTLGQIGDLVESHIKRACGVKDSSQIIPGHGGILDRFDSLLFVAPFVYLYVLISFML